MRHILTVALIAVPLLVSGAAMAQDRDNGIDDRAEQVVSQPLKDIGAMKQKPPEILLKAQKAPYSLAGMRRCADYIAEINRLSEVLGPDVDAVDEQGRPAAGRLAQAGASALVNSLIPLRGLVREATGAAEADRRFQAMVAAGVARRGFLKGYATARGCKL